MIFYFSDHSLDIYDTSPDYYGNGIPVSPHSYSTATDIPFMIYASIKYKHKYPENIDRIKLTVNEKLYTEDFIYILMDILNVEFIGNDGTSRCSKSNHFRD